MVIRGKVWIFGDDINTDLIIPARFLISSHPEELGKNLFADLIPGFSQKIERGDVIVAGKNFGCGSSREHAPLAIKGAGISSVIAISFARIFFRNAINIGLPIIECKEAKEIGAKEELEIDLKQGKIRNLTQHKIYDIQPFPEFLQELINQGGLLNWIKENKYV
ncbi:MAG: 3-isopropylmalate dehydratase small subunit [Candidatus Omnitrophica bacterium]|nr:3-isopropylmalate dehydratase small subunit [Candidatus Omnitrophota bacterium]MCM8792896.1 3-isopropylmalate dehydratase small subunit [Candidatus Omnitrophota bacterium]